MSKIDSKCMYCGSTSYGSGCIFSSHRMHIHVDDPTKCIYCGMMSYGSGCIFNPFTRMHVHGMDIGQTIKETTRKTVELTYLTDRILSSIQDNEAYKAKLIDKKGNIIRVPVNLHEQRLISPLSRLFVKLKNYISVDAETLCESLKLTNVQEETPEEYEQKLQLEHEAKHLVIQLNELIKKNITKMSLENIEAAIESAILESTLS
jgi:hypothetical protein